LREQIRRKVKSEGDEPIALGCTLRAPVQGKDGVGAVRLILGLLRSEKRKEEIPLEKAERTSKGGREHARHLSEAISPVEGKQTAPNE